jgi:hypothetical protein
LALGDKIAVKIGAGHAAISQVFGTILVRANLFRRLSTFAKKCEHPKDRLISERHGTEWQPFMHGRT